MEILLNDKEQVDTEFLVNEITDMSIGQKQVMLTYMQGFNQGILYVKSKMELV